MNPRGARFLCQSQHERLNRFTIVGACRQVRVLVEYNDPPRYALFCLCCVVLDTTTAACSPHSRVPPLHLLDGLLQQQDRVVCSKPDWATKVVAILKERQLG